MHAIIAIHPFHDAYGLKNRAAAVVLGVIGLSLFVAYNRVALGATVPGRIRGQAVERPTPDARRLLWKLTLVVIVIIVGAATVFLIERM